MNYIVISPYYPKNFQAFTLALKQQGVNVLGIGQEPYEQLDDSLKNALTEYFRVNNLEDVEEVKRAVAFLFHKHGPIDRIESHNEYWLELDAALRTQFNVFGATAKELKKTKFKSEMKRYFKKAGVPVVPGAVVAKASDVDKVIKKLKLPLIAKPDNGVGTAKTYKLLSEEDVTLFKQEWDQTTPYFFEQFVNAETICTFDGLLDRDGNIVFATSLTYNYPTFEWLNPAIDSVYHVEKQIPEKLLAYGEATIKAFGMKERFFHIEFFKDGDDYIAIEYNNRPAGGYSIDVYNFAHSIDLYHDYAAVVTGAPLPERHFEPQYALAVSRRDKTHYAHSHEEIANRYYDRLKMYVRMPDAFADLLGNQLYVITTDQQQEVDEIIAYIGEKAVD